MSSYNCSIIFIYEQGDDGPTLVYIYAPEMVSCGPTKPSTGSNIAPTNNVRGVFKIIFLTTGSCRLDVNLHLFREKDEGEVSNEIRANTAWQSEQSMENIPELDGDGD